MNAQDPQDDAQAKAKKMSLDEEQVVAEEDVLDDAAELSVEELQQKLAAAEDALKKAQDSELRALADYKNVVRRAQEDKFKTVKMAAKDVILAILLPLDHLHLAKEQLKDHGLDMVYQQFQQALQGQGVQEIEAIGQPFDEHKMEVVDKQPVNDPVQENVVVGVTQRGYTLNGEILRHARVVIGVPAEKK